MCLDMYPPSALTDDRGLIVGDEDTEACEMLKRDLPGYGWAESVQYESQNGEPDRIQADGREIRSHAQA